LAEAFIPRAKQVVAALILQQDKVLICQRTQEQAMPLKWEFPGGKIEPGEDPITALRRELQEELGINATIGELISRIEHRYKHGGVVELQFFVVRKFENELQNRIFKDVRWEKLAELPKYDFLEADRDLIQQLAAGKLL
jgi:8-oxo-dGTP diphosphatase